MRAKQSITLTGLIFTLSFLCLSPLTPCDSGDSPQVPDGIRSMLKTLEGDGRKLSESAERVFAATAN